MVIQELKPSRHVEGRWLAVLEDGSILRVGEGEVVEFALYAGKELSEEETERLQDAAHRSGLKSKAIELLMRKPQSRKELGRKLREWEATDEEIEAICDRMEELGYLNEREYAGQIVRHYAGKGFGSHDPKDVKRASDALARRGYRWPEISDALRRYGMEVWED